MVFCLSVVTALLSVSVVMCVIKLLVLPQMGTRPVVALCTIRQAHRSPQDNCVHLSVEYMTGDGSFSRGYILPFSRKQANITDNVSMPYLSLL